MKTNEIRKQPQASWAKIVQICTIKGQEIECVNKMNKKNTIKNDNFYYYILGKRSDYPIFGLILKKIALKKIEAFQLKIYNPILSQYIKRNRGLYQYFKILSDN